jgi:hypothetical protein
MPDIGKLRRVVQHDEFLDLFPCIEELLVRGSKEQRRDYAEELNERAQGEEVMAFSLAGGDGDGLHLADPELWKQLEENGRLSRVLGYWSRAQQYRYWSRVLCCDAVTTLEWFGFNDTVSYGPEFR